MKAAQQIVMDTAKMRLELKSSLLLNYILVQRLGGRVEVTQEEFSTAKGQIITGHMEEENKWFFLAAPEAEPEPETPAIEVVGG